MPLNKITILLLTGLGTTACTSQSFYEFAQPIPSTCNNLLQAEREECLQAQEPRMSFEEYEKIRKEAKTR